MPVARRRPAAAPALAFLAGIALADPAIGAAFTCGLLAAIGLFATAFTTSRRRSIAAALAAVVLGGWAGIDAQRRHDARVEWLPDDGQFVEVSLEGRVVRAPEVDAHGDRRLIVVGGSPAAGRRQPARVRLRVRSGSRPDWIASLDSLRHGDRVRAFARIGVPSHAMGPRGTDPARSLRARGLDAVGSVKSPALIERTARGSPSLTRIVESVRIEARRRLSRAFPQGEPTGTVLSAMLLGEREGLGRDTYRTLRDAGMAHVVAISGLHVGLVVLILTGALRRSSVPVVVSSSLAACALGIFGLLVGARAPVLRAVGCGVILLVGRVLHRDASAINTVVSVAAILAAARPAWLGDPAYQLSFVAVSAIVLLAGPIAHHLPVGRLLGASAAVSVVAYGATTCAVAWHFGRLAPVAVLSNLAAVPLCGFILATGFATIVLEPVPWLGPMSAGAAALGVDALLGLAAAASAIPGGAFRVAAPSVWLAGVCHALWAVGACVATGAPPPHPHARRRALAVRLISLFIVVAVVRVHLGPWPGAAGGRVEIAVLDVGQGQAVVIRGTHGRCALIDAAGTSGGRFDVGERVVAPWLSRLGCARLEVLVITHDHDDHAGGAAALLDEIEVDELWFPAGTHGRPRTRELLDRARERGIATVSVARGFRVRRAGVDLEVLHPTPWLWDLDVNDRSVVLRILTGGGTVLVAGDLESPGEDNLLLAGIDPRSDVLVAGHHGAANASSWPFLSRVRPRIAVISAGVRNRFGHPSRDTLARLARIGARTYRTDLDGTVTLRPTSRGWELSTAGVSPAERPAGWE